ncbi:hypothetical protein F2P81_013169 [Scophthalmus maximus]|uniref:Uncharacterized protein n=1 Tax=Scophthalmus maximus TaxID=52904 RepID=A0A6A4SWN5_SCOMX|nr:hypothetical protein F2P81_013169 [Scophthalmus maximus]
MTLREPRSPLPSLTLRSAQLLYLEDVGVDGLRSRYRLHTDADELRGLLSHSVLSHSSFSKTSLVQVFAKQRKSEEGSSNQNQNQLYLQMDCPSVMKSGPPGGTLSTDAESAAGFHPALRCLKNCDGAYACQDHNRLRRLREYTGSFPSGFRLQVAY